MKSLKKNIAFYEANEEDAISELSNAMLQNTLHGELVDITRVEVVDLREERASKDSVINYIVQDLCVLLVPCGRSFSGTFCVVINESLCDAFDLFTLTPNIMPLMLSMVSLANFRKVLRRKRLSPLLKANKSLITGVLFRLSSCR